VTVRAQNVTERTTTPKSGRAELLLGRARLFSRDQMEVDAVPPFQLRATLAGHEQDVRSVCSSEGKIVTASRDSSLRVWKAAEEEADGPPSYSSVELLGHAHYVSAVAPTAAGGITSGSNDKTLIEWDLATGAPGRVLQGHTDVVSSVASSPLGAIFSASWDKTARVWKDGECVRTLSGHKAAVWCVLPLDDAEEHILTASADHTCKLWKGEACVTTFTGHTDVVRGLALLPDVGFLSASNDGTVRLWALTGDCLRVLCASETFVYSVAVLPSGEWITCSEDRNLRVWDQSSDNPTQSITHPSTVWACAPLPNGDIVTGCADGNGYIWTRTASRAAPLDVQTGFKESVAAVAMPAQQVNEGMLGDLNTSELSSEEALATPGTREGQHKIVKDSASGNPMLYQWSSISSTWEKIGEVVNAKGDSGATIGKRTYRGKEYDYLFDIDMNGAPMQIPFNRGDDPWMAAQKWIWENGIDQDHLGSIAEHLIANTPGNVPSTSSGNADPFTSGGAYTPVGTAASSVAGGGGSSNVDPFTSGGAYRPGASAAPSAPSASTGFEDPVSSKRYRPGDADAAAAALKAAPPLPFLVFDTCKHDAVLAKLLEFDEALVASPEPPAAPLGDAGRASLTKLVALIKNRGMYHASKVSAADLALFTGAGGAGGLLSWPLSRVFPALDLLRCLLLHPDAAKLAAGAGGTPPLLPRLLSLLASVQPPGTTDKMEGAARLMALRGLANLAANPNAARREGQAAAAELAPELLDALGPSIEHGPSAARLAACTLLLTITSILRQGELPPAAATKAEAAQLQGLSLCAHALSLGALLEPAEEESLTRALSALSALVALEGGAATARDLDLGGSLAALALPASASSRAKELVAGLVEKLK
jgi:phospholipase A-2-activating protein